MVAAAAGVRLGLWVGLLSSVRTVVAGFPFPADGSPLELDTGAGKMGLRAGAEGLAAVLPFSALSVIFLKGQSSKFSFFTSFIIRF
jgi:hypothetical protein